VPNVRTILARCPTRIRDGALMNITFTRLRQCRARKCLSRVPPTYKSPMNRRATIKTTTGKPWALATIKLKDPSGDASSTTVRAMATYIRLRSTQTNGEARRGK